MGSAVAAAGGGAVAVAAAGLPRRACVPSPSGWDWAWKTLPAGEWVRSRTVGSGAREARIEISVVQCWTSLQSATLTHAGPHRNPPTAGAVGSTAVASDRAGHCVLHLRTIKESV